MEKDIKASINRYLNEISCFHFNYTPWLGKAGVPDKIIIAPDYPAIFVEVKRPGKEPTALQRATHRSLAANGGIVFVVTSLDDLKKCLSTKGIILKKRKEKSYE